MPIIRTVTFIAPREIEIREAPLTALSPDEVLVETICSAISPSTEMLIYRGQFPRDIPNSHDFVSSSLHYPLAYGYANEGQIIEISRAVDNVWENRRVFAFQPHTSHFVTTPEHLLPVPNSIEPDIVCFLASMETAVNLVQDSAPILGERALVLGQGIIGLLNAALLNKFPLDSLGTTDCYP